jgi:hypothetical protein
MEIAAGFEPAEEKGIKSGLRKFASIRTLARRVNLRGHLRLFHFELSATVRTVYHAIYFTFKG